MTWLVDCPWGFVHCVVDKASCDPVPGARDPVHVGEQNVSEGKLLPSDGVCDPWPCVCLYAGDRGGSPSAAQSVLPRFFALEGGGGSLTENSLLMSRSFTYGSVGLWCTAMFRHVL